MRYLFIFLSIHSFLFGKIFYLEEEKLETDTQIKKEQKYIFSYDTSYLEEKTLDNSKSFYQLGIKVHSNQTTLTFHRQLAKEQKESSLEVSHKRVVYKTAIEGLLYYDSRDFYTLHIGYETLEPKIYSLGINGFFTHIDRDVIGAELYLKNNFTNSFRTILRYTYSLEGDDSFSFFSLDTRTRINDALVFAVGYGEGRKIGEVQNYFLQDRKLKKSYNAGLFYSISDQMTFLFKYTFYDYAFDTQSRVYSIKARYKF